MSNDPEGAVFGKGLKEQILLQSELTRLDTQLDNFAPVRDRLVAVGQDPNVKYRETLSRRNQVIFELKKLRSAAVRPADAGASIVPSGFGSLLSLPIAPPRFLGPGLGPWFGYAGSVQMGQPSSVDPFEPDRSYSSGGILEIGRDAAGGIQYTGDCNLGNPPPGRTTTFGCYWCYLVPFPMASRRSIFTYSFDVTAQVVSGSVSGTGAVYSHVALGETADYQGQTGLGLLIDGPSLASEDWYENKIGFKAKGIVHVQRSFVVAPGKSPAIEIGLGVLVNEEPNSQLWLDDSGNCYLIPSSDGVEGRVNFRFDPDRESQLA
jgi:hypothetical protein